MIRVTARIAQSSGRMMGNARRSRLIEPETLKGGGMLRSGSELFEVWFGWPVGPGPGEESAGSVLVGDG